MRKLLTKTDVFVLCGILAAAALCALFFLFPRGGRLTAEITTDAGVETVDLSSVHEPYEKEIVSNGHRLTLAIFPGSVAVVSADCMDQTCVSCGTLTRPGACAVCLPAKVVVRLIAQDSESGVDAVL